MWSSGILFFSFPLFTTRSNAQEAKGTILSNNKTHDKTMLFTSFQVVQRKIPPIKAEMRTPDYLSSIWMEAAFIDRKQPSHHGHITM